MLLTEATASLLSQDETVTDLGRHRLKDFDRPARLLQLGTDAHPPLRTPGTVLLPTPATPFLGRERELYDAVSLVVTEAPPILTILGPGGTGKTRFAIELSRLVAEDADGGTVFVPLAALRDPALVLPAIAGALGAEGVTAEGITARVGGRRTHLVLDNVEQLLPGVAAVLASVVEATPALRLVVTSREALNVSAETRFDLPPLALDEASAFFVDRARRVDATIEPSETVTWLCERLDRLPLALELAAARTRLLTPEAILDRLSERLDLPAQRDADPRHATLRATIQWSYDLLRPAERELFSNLAIFRGGCTLDAAEDVCGADLETLVSLLDKSLLRRRTPDGAVDRYWMLETIREFALATLDERGEGAAALRARHAHRMLSIARSANLDVGLEPLTPRFEVIRPEIEDMRAAVDWATEADPVLAAELVKALEMFWTTQALAEGRRRTQALLDQGSVIPAALRAALLTIHGGTIILIENNQAAGEPSYHEAIELYRELGDVRGEAKILMRLARPRRHSRPGRRGAQAHRSCPHDDGRPRPAGTRGSEPQHPRVARGARRRARGCIRALRAVGRRRGGMRLHALGDVAADQRGGDRAETRTVRRGRSRGADRPREVMGAWRPEDRPLRPRPARPIGPGARRPSPGRPLVGGGHRGGRARRHPARPTDEFTRLIAPLRATSDPELASGIDLGKTASLAEAVALALAPP